MAYVSKGRKEERFPKLPTRQYIAQLEETMLMNSEQWGDFQSVKWKIIAPDEFTGRYFWEKFYFHNPDLQERDKAECRYDDFMRQVAGLEAGAEDDSQLFLGKVCFLDIYRGEFKKEPGKFFNKVNSRKVVSDHALSALMEQLNEQEKIMPPAGAEVKKVASAPQPLPSNIDDFEDDIPM
jgi:hypothetical protein